MRLADTRTTAERGIEERRPSDAAPARSRPTGPSAEPSRLTGRPTAPDVSAGAGAGPAGPSPTGPARLLAEVNSSGSLADHRRRYPAPPTRLSAQAQAGLIDLIERSGLSGRGGAGFPVARKLRAAAAKRAPAVVVVNGAEGEPASGKDGLLLTRAPHIVLDGAVLAAASIGADRISVCIDRTNTSALAAIRRAVAERRADQEAAIVIEVAGTPPRYVAGESSAMVQWLNHGPAKPTGPSQEGVAGRPALVHNAETLAHLAQIATFGPEWFRQAGTAAEPGTMLVTVSGAVGRPTIVEAAIGTPVGNILAAAGDLIGSPHALLIGGFFGTWALAGATQAAPFSRAGLAPVGAAPGAGVLIALPEGACGLAETARVLAWYAAESAGQCGPCLYGLADLAAGAASLARPSAAGTPTPVAQLRRWADQIEGRGACHHPDGAVNLLRSALRVFAADLDRHTQGWPCLGAGAPPALPVPATHTTWR